MKTKKYLSLVLAASMTISSCFSVPIVNAEANAEQIKTLLENYIEQNYKGDAYLRGESDEGVLYCVVFRSTTKEGDIHFDTHTIWGEFDKFYAENNIDPAKVRVVFLEGNNNININIGDIDINGSIDVTDLTELSLALVGDKELTADQKFAADIDGDGTVSIADLARLQQYLSKKIDKF